MQKLAFKLDPNHTYTSIIMEIVLTTQFFIGLQSYLTYKRMSSEEAKIKKHNPIMHAPTLALSRFQDKLADSKPAPLSPS